MKTLTLAMISGLLLASSSLESKAQDGACLASFNIPKQNQDKPITSYGWLPGYQPAAGTLTCKAAEALRTNLYVRNREAIEATVSSDRAQYIANLEQASKSLAQKIAELRGKISANETAAALQTAAEVVLYELTKVGTMIACLAPEPAVSKLTCAAGLIKTGLDTVKIASGQIVKNEFKAIADRAQSELEQLNKELEVTKAKLKESEMPAVRSQATSLFTGLCQAVRTDCL
jgi:hypothetical protein